MTDLSLKEKAIDFYLGLSKDEKLKLKNYINEFHKKQEKEKNNLIKNDILNYNEDKNLKYELEDYKRFCEKYINEKILEVIDLARNEDKNLFKNSYKEYEQVYQFYKKIFPEKEEDKKPLKLVKEI
jgi:hypothetical protein